MKKIASTAVLVLVLVAAGIMWFEARSPDDPYHQGVLPGAYGGRFVPSSTDEADGPSGIRQRSSSTETGRLESPDLKRSSLEAAEQQSDARIRVSGNKSLSAELIAGNISIPPGATREEIVAMIHNQVVGLYHSLGFIPTEVSHLEIHDGDPPTIELSINEGSFRRFGNVELQGDTAGIQDTSLLPKQGDAVDYSQVKQSRAVFQNQLADLGYLDATVVPVVTSDAIAGTMDFTLNINKGPRYTVGQITAPPGVYLPLQPGDFFLQGLLRAYLESIGINSLASLHISKDPATGLVDISIDP